MTRLPDARIAGRDAAGLRVRTADARSTIEHIDVWALPSDGLPVRVRVYARGDRNPVLETALLDLSTSPPAASLTTFELPRSAKGRSDEQADIVTAIDQFGRSTLRHGWPAWPGSLTTLAQSACMGRA